MLKMGPLEFLVLRNEFQEIHLLLLPSSISLAVRHFHWVFPLNPFNISIDAFTCNSAVEGLGKVIFNTVPAVRAAFLQVLQMGNFQF